MAEIVLTDGSFEQEVLKSSIPVLVDFWAEWCQPCHMVAPIIEELGKEYEGKIKVGKLNVDENAKTPSAYGVMSIPTIIIFNNGEPLKTMIGVQSRDNFKNNIEATLTS